MFYEEVFGVVTVRYIGSPTAFERMWENRLRRQYFAKGNLGNVS